MTAGHAVTLGELLMPVSREETVDAGKEYRLLGARWYAKGLYIKETRSGAEIRARTLYRVAAGDFVYNRLFAWKGSFAVASEEHDGCFVSSEFPCFEVDRSRLDPRFLWLYFSRQKAWSEALVLSSGSTPTSRNRLKEEQFLRMVLPLPSPSQQRRIVARIEELAVKVDEARRLHNQIVVESQAILPSAAIELFNSISNAPRLPIESVAEVRGGIQKGPHRAPGANPVRYLTVAHVQRNYISLSDARFFEVSPDELKRWRLEAGDVLIIEGNGSPEQIGRTALFRGEIRDCVHQNHVIRIRPSPEVIDPEFLNSFLNSPPGQDEVHARSRTTSGLRNLSIGRIKEIMVPAPSLDEQHRIVVHLATMQERLDKLKRLQAETAAELDALLLSILDRAFKGEL